MARMVSIALAASIFAGMPSLALADEESARLKDQGSIVALLDKRNFVELNKMDEELTEKHVLGLSGTPRIDFFYETLAWYIDGKGSGSLCPIPMQHVVTEWNSKTPRSPAAIILKSITLRNQAWCIRGQGYASEVNPMKWPEFNALIEQARFNLEEKKPIASVDPEWYITMESIARAQGWSNLRFNELFAEATDKFPDSYYVYYGGIDRLFPQWGGSLAEMESFATAQAKKAYKWHGDKLYAKLYWHVFDEMPAPNLRAQTAINWDHMKHSMESIAEQYPDEWNIAKLARISCGSGDGNETKIFLNEIQWRYDHQYWNNEQEYRKCVTLAQHGD